MAKACIHVMQHTNFKDLIADSKEIKNTHINIGTGEDISIKALAQLIQRTTQYKGELLWDASKPDGTPRKLTNVSKLHDLGWNHEVDLENGVGMMYAAYLRN
jgi:GDP-L-fucose synthase